MATLKFMKEILGSMEINLKVLQIKVLELIQGPELSNRQTTTSSRAKR